MEAEFVVNNLLSIVDESRAKLAKHNLKAMFVAASIMESKQLECVLVCQSTKEMWN